MRKFCRFFYCLAWFDTFELNRLLCPNDNIYDDLVFAHRFRYPLTMFGKRVWIVLSRHFMIVLHRKLILPKSSSHSAELSIVCMVWYGWIQSPTVSKRQDVRWCSFCWSIPLSIAYAWESRFVRVISTPSCSYCISNWYCQNHRRIPPNFLLFEWLCTLNSIDCRVQTTRCTTMYFSLIDTVIHWLCVKCAYWYGYLKLLYIHIVYEIVI